jgi:hypothetical protein
MQSITVFCGSNFGFSEEYRKLTVELAQEIVRRNLRLVYGGANRGLMGVLADAVISAGGQVKGIMSRGLFEKGHLHPQVHDFEVVDTLRQRKSLLTEYADMFLALPGGLGTFDELFEVLSLIQLGEQSKACGILNVRGFFDPLLGLLANTVKEGFMKQEHMSMLVVESTPAAALNALHLWKAPVVYKWFDDKHPS